MVVPAQAIHAAALQTPQLQMCRNANSTSLCRHTRTLMDICRLLVSCVVCQASTGTEGPLPPPGGTENLSISLQSLGHTQTDTTQRPADAAAAKAGGGGVAAADAPGGKNMWVNSAGFGSSHGAIANSRQQRSLGGQLQSPKLSCVTLQAACDDRPSLRTHGSLTAPLSLSLLVCP